jgi:hypothetical protein
MTALDVIYVCIIADLMGGLYPKQASIAKRK